MPLDSTEVFAEPRMNIINEPIGPALDYLKTAFWENSVKLRHVKNLSLGRSTREVENDPRLSAEASDSDSTCLEAI